MTNEQTPRNATTSDLLLSTYLDFYRDRGHRQVTGTSLIPPLDDPVLFTTSGMHPLTPYLLGRPHPSGSRLVDVQRCLRTTDLDEVGDPSHLTVFEMLGAWSLGDYDHPQSLRWGVELLTDALGVDRSLLHATVFGGDDQLGADEPALRACAELGLPVELLGEDNWWSSGPTGLCGPDSELFFWTGDGPPLATPGTDDRWVEIGNHVGMRYLRRTDGGLDPLPRPNVDVGTGLERLLAVLQGVRSVYDTDLFRPWTQAVDRWSLDPAARRVVVDHLRSSVAIIGDGVLPAASGRGYVLRRLLRRSLTRLWQVEPSCSLDDLPDGPVEHALGHFRQLGTPGDVRRVWRSEERRFRDLVRRGRPLVARQLRSARSLTADDYAYLHETHGLPRELVEDLLTDRP